MTDIRDFFFLTLDECYLYEHTCIAFWSTYVCTFVVFSIVPDDPFEEFLGPKTLELVILKVLILKEGILLRKNDLNELGLDTAHWQVWSLYH